jgi:hypothetical protein
MCGIFFGRLPVLLRGKTLAIPLGAELNTVKVVHDMSRSEYLRPDPNDVRLLAFHLNLGGVAVSVGLDNVDKVPLPQP